MYHHFLRAAARNRNHESAGIGAKKVVSPFFQPELATEDPKENEQRWVDYQQKLIAWRKAA